MLTLVPRKSPRNRYFYLLSAFWIGSPTYMPCEFIPIPMKLKGFSRIDESGKSAGNSRYTDHLTQRFSKPALKSIELKIKLLDGLQ